MLPVVPIPKALTILTAVSSFVNKNVVTRLVVTPINIGTESSTPYGYTNAPPPHYYVPPHKAFREDDKL